MINKPLDLWQLRELAATKAWEAYRTDSDSEKVPSSFSHAVDIVIREAYINIDRMITESVRNRLENLCD